MAEAILKDNTPWFLSLIFHVILYLIIVNINNDLIKLKNDAAITISIISPKKEEVIIKQDDKKQIKNTKKIENPGHKKRTIKNNKKEIKDLSYSKEDYIIDSKRNPLPPYPRMAKLRNYQGNLEITVITNFLGNVINANIHRSSGYPILDNSALRTLKKWRFNIKNLSTDSVDKNQQYRIIVPINFILG